VGCATCFESETCAAKTRECFPNSGIVKTGTPDPNDPETVALFCITTSHYSAVDSTAGLPGQGAIRQPTTILRTGLN